MYIGIDLNISMGAWKMCRLKYHVVEKVCSWETCRSWLNGSIYEYMWKIHIQLKLDWSVLKKKKRGKQTNPDSFFHEMWSQFRHRKHCCHWTLTLCVDQSHKLWTTIMDEDESQSRAHVTHSRRKSPMPSLVSVPFSPYLYQRKDITAPQVQSS